MPRAWTDRHVNESPAHTFASRKMTPLELAVTSFLTKLDPSSTHLFSSCVDQIIGAMLSQVGLDWLLDLHPNQTE